MRFADALGLELESIITLNPNQSIAHQSNLFRQHHLNPTPNIQMTRRFRIGRNPNLVYFDRVNSYKSTPTPNPVSTSTLQPDSNPFEEHYETIVLEQRQYNNNNNSYNHRRGFDQHEVSTTSSSSPTTTSSSNSSPVTASITGGNSPNSQITITTRINNGKLESEV